jgi:ABC-type lipoprotein release transport system permease subunit
VTTATLVRRGLAHHRRVHAAAVLGVATATAVLGGALLVGESVRGSLRDLALERLGGTHHVVRAGRDVREALAADLGAIPIIATTGSVTAEDSGRRASGAAVFGVDDRFWRLHGGRRRGPDDREAFLSPALAEELAAGPGGTVLVAVERPADIPSSSLFGRRDDLARTVRVSVAAAVPAAEGGEFALEPTQRPVRAVFVPLALLQRTIERPGRVNTLLVGSGTDAAAVASRVRAAATLDDLGVRVRAVGGGAVAVESASGLVDGALARAAGEAAADVARPTSSVLTYLANAIRANGREVPYSVVAAVDGAALAAFGVAAPAGDPPPIVLNDWTARELRAAPGDRVALDYYLWHDEGRLETASAEFAVAAVVPMTGLAADRDLVPEYPGITTSEHLADWDPPFPLDLGRVRPVDEEYWTRHRATPKAFVPLAVGQRLWGHRLGALTSVRVAAADAEAYAHAVRARLDPLALGLAVDPARERALASAEGATDFGEYFTYFSAFLVASALLLAVLFFRLGLEQRASELGLLRAVGFTPARLRRAFLAEATVVALAGGALGAAGGTAWAGALVTALGTVWSGAVGTRALALHVAPAPLLLGAAIVIACALAAAAWTLRDLGRRSPRALLSGETGPPAARASPSWRAALALAAAALALTAATAAGGVPPVAGFFGAALVLLAAALASTRAWLRRPASGPVPAGAAGIARLGWRGARHRPGRSVLVVALIASATFLVAAVGAFRRDPAHDARRDSGTGGYTLLAESAVPIPHDLALPSGRAEVGLEGEWPVRRVARFHLREGDDTSCLNLYRPRDPRVIAPEPRFLAEGGFRFRESLAADAETKANPWLLLERVDPGGAAPVIADAASLQYVLHRKVGDEIAIERPGAPPVRLRVVASLEDSVFQSELVMGESAFRRRFPDRDGYRVFLLDAPAAGEGDLTARLESALGDEGLDVTRVGDRLAAFHRVENTYLATFQSLGALGLALGTVGLGAVLLRNALERRREIALLRALGYRPGQVSGILVAENAALLGLGVIAGLVSAAVAVVPPLLRRGGGTVPITEGAAVALAVLAAGLLASAAAAAVVRRSPLLAALRSE